MKKLLLSVMCLAAMWSCNTQDPENGKIDAGNTYMKLSLKMETKSATNTGGGSDAAPGTEVGLDKENKISSVDVVLKASNGNCVVANDVVPDAAATDTYVASFSTLDLTAGAIYEVYIYANCSAPLTGNSPTATLDLDATSSETVANMTKDGEFWMTNAYAATTTTLPADLSLYTLPQNPLNLGSHSVERSMARFDFMPINNNAYNIMKGNAINATVTLTEAALINQSNAHYMLRRVSANGTNTDWSVGGIETNVNYVVDTDYAAKAGGYAEGLAANFTAHLTTPGSWTWKSIAVADLTQADNWEGTEDGTSGTNSSHSLNDYYIWQYAKENTIPGVDAQQNGISTGIVFKGEITGDAVTAAGGETIYVFENVLYGKWSAVEEAANDASAPATLVAAVNKIKAVDGTPASADYANAGFTGYSPEDGKYYAYYYYWNRHNDNGNNAEMGTMEFAVVRNNVYKLCVDKIAKFGHPTPGGTDPDPDPVVPTDPNEELDYYFTVTVKVLPWVVRVNHIEF